MRVIAFTSGLRFMIAVCNHASKGVGCWPSTTSPRRFMVSRFDSVTKARLIRGVIRKCSLLGIRALTWPNPSTNFLCDKIRQALTMSFLSCGTVAFMKAPLKFLDFAIYYDFPIHGKESCHENQGRIPT